MEHASVSSAEPTPSRPRPGMIQHAAVLGAGTMGVRIAAHLANAGIPVVLLDLAGDPSKGPAAIAESALQSLSRAKPAAFYDPASIRLIQPGTFDHDLSLLSKCDWVIEAVTENLAIKQEILAKITPFLKPGVILTTNTSGLPIASIATALAPELRRSWFGTHFFNPPRYMRLLEVISTPESDPAAIADFADRRLGKTVVYARDTPNFIANRIGVYIMVQAIELMQQQGLTIEEVDVLTGSAIGWPRTGSFRLSDMVGLDVLAHVVANFSQSRAGESLQLRLLLRPCWSVVGWVTKPARASIRRSKTRKATNSGSRSTGKPLPTVQQRAPSFPHWNWPRTPNHSPSGSACPWPAIFGKTKNPHSNGNCSAAFLPTPPTACPR